MNKKKNILIYGSIGINDNLGDQAMLFTLIDHLKKQGKNNIFLLNDKEYNNSNIYNFKILKDIPLKFMIKDINKLIYYLYAILKKTKKEELKNIYKSIEIYKNCDLIYCLNGFLLTSQLPFIPVIGSLLKLIYAKKNKKKLILLPQSVGPFEYKGIKKIIFEYLFKKAMNYPEKIYLREKYGYKLYEERNIKNIEVEYDIVLSKY